MTVSKDPVAKARARLWSAALRYIKVIAEEAPKHEEALKAGNLPEGSFAASAVKYAEAIAGITLLDSLGTPDEAANGMQAASPEDLALLIGVLRQTRIGPNADQPLLPDEVFNPAHTQTPIGRLVAIAYPGGLPPLPAPEPAQPLPAPVQGPGQ